MAGGDFPGDGMRVFQRIKPFAPSTAGVAAALAVFVVLFVVTNSTYLAFVTPRFPQVGTSASLATLWGILARLYLLIPAAVLVLWRPRLLGFQMGSVRQHWRLLLLMLMANCGIVALYLKLTASGTPYSGNQWLFTEVVTVPLVEEMVWRGIVCTAVFRMLRKSHSEANSQHLAVWLSGLAFGVLHLQNAAYGIPLLFAAIQALNASVWGVVYGYARMRTDSIYPAILLHAAMNLVVVLF
jgi:membrane protease YdiL (CAAX protease family)